MFNKANVVGILIKAKKHGLVFFDGEIVFAVSSRLCHDSLAVCAFDVCGLCAPPLFSQFDQRTTMSLWSCKNQLERSEEPLGR